MVSCQMPKRIYNFGDEALAQAWEMDPYMQYFRGGSHVSIKFFLKLNCTRWHNFFFS
ncbi:MAG: hypothetical protein GQ574_24760 [Crocinitomix sp.]|nr:hypothetical protein [Crocinitomix sp.]